MEVHFSATVSDGVLSQWREALVCWVRSDNPDLTNRQMAVLMVISHDPMQHTVRGLASRLGIPKPAVTRVVDRLSHLKYVKRVIDKRDRRNVFVEATEAGAIFLDKFAHALQ